MAKGGIYKITNTKNGYVYIGQTSNFNKRKNAHFCSLKRNSHQNNLLQKDFNLYGEKSFLFEEIQIETDNKRRLELEKQFINEYIDKCYNKVLSFSPREENENYKKYISLLSKFKKISREFKKDKQYYENTIETQEYIIMQLKKELKKKDCEIKKMRINYQILIDNTNFKNEETYNIFLNLLENILDKKNEEMLKLFKQTFDKHVIT